MLGVPNDGRYRMPPEWAPHLRTWMLWPHDKVNWYNNAANVSVAFTTVVKAIAKFEPVFVGVNDNLMNVASQSIGSIPNVQIVCIESDDIWTRDTGPTFVFDKLGDKLVGINWKFNGWGHPDIVIDKDIHVGRLICEHAFIECVRAPFVLEGGSFNVDGEGTLLTTEECLLNSNRNPTLSKDDIERYLKFYLGVTKIIWLRRGLTADDDTNGHIDNMACFAKPGTIMLAWTDDVTDPQYEISQDALSILQNTTDAKGRSIDVIKLPIPPRMEYALEECNGMIFRKPGERLAGSYCNFYMTNGGIVCASFNCVESDRKAFSIFSQTFPDREIIQVPGRDILLGGGNFHCITQQQPSEDGFAIYRIK